MLNNSFSIADVFSTSNLNVFAHDKTRTSLSSESEYKISPIPQSIIIYWTGDDVNSPITQETVNYVKEKTYGRTALDRDSGRILFNC